MLCKQNEKNEMEVWHVARQGYSWSYSSLFASSSGRSCKGPSQISMHDPTQDIKKFQKCDFPNLAVVQTRSFVRT
jgi:hypothetical protein